MSAIEQIAAKLRDLERRVASLEARETPVIWRNAGAPTGGTYADQVAAGDLLVDTTNKKLYINTGSSTAPTWVVVGTQT